MKIIPALACATTLFTLSAASYACDYPSKVDIPNGSTASKEEMIDGQRDVKDFVAKMEVYLECLVAEEKSTRAQMDDLTAEEEQAREDMLNKKYNAAVDDMEKVAAQFNDQVQAYRARNP